MGKVTSQQASPLDPLGPPGKVAALLSTALVVFFAPLLVGSVHPWSMVSTAVLAGLGTGALVVWSAASRRLLRGGRFALPFVVLTGLTTTQIIPLSMGLRGLLDPNGNELLANAPPPPLAAFPLSLDPFTTRIELLRVGLTLVVFLLCLNLSAGRRGHGPLLLGCIAASGFCAVLVGVAHPLLNYSKIYGLFSSGSPTLIGPFINPNHNAEFMELGCFAAIACALNTQERLRRIGWLGAAALMAAAALVTLSRGSLIGLASGAITLILGLRFGVRLGPSQASRMAWFVPAALIATLVTVGLAVALGAVPLYEEVTRLGVVRPGEKTEVWADSLKVLMAHPLGIGRGAFDRVYPAYRTLSSPVQQNFVENEPLQLLLDLGWVGFMAFVGSVVYTAVAVRRRTLRDPVEVAIGAALIAVAAHNVFDFGLETLGLRIPAAALSGIFVGRLLGSRRPSDAGPSKTWIPLAIGVGASLIGLQAVAVSEDFDSQLRLALPPAQGKIALKAAKVHPTDYLYPLTQARSEPLRQGTGSPKLVALGRATRLCPNCAPVHRATGIALWHLGYVAQSLAEYRVAIDLDPPATGGVLDELYRLGASAEQVASIRATEPVAALALSQTLIDRKSTGAGPRGALEHARLLGANSSTLDLLGARLAINEGDFAKAIEILEQVDRKTPGTPLVSYWRSVVEDSRGAPVAALNIATQGSTLHPDDLPLARQRLSLALKLRAWGDVERAVESLKRALQSAGANVGEAYLLSAQAYRQRGNVPRALRDYQTATSIEPANLSAWLELAATAEEAGYYTQALTAYHQVLRQQAGNTAANQGIERIRGLRERLNADPTSLRTP